MPARRLVDPSRGLVVLVLLSLLVAASATPFGATAAQAVTARERTDDERRLEQLLFEHHLTARADPGAFGHGSMGAQPPLRWADDVAAVARAWSDEMARTRVFAHNPHFTSQTCCWQRIGENIVMGGPGYLGFLDVEGIAERFMQLWMDSDGHRQNLMHGSHEHVALGASIAADGAVYVTAVLRTPTRDAPPGSPGYPVLASGDQAPPADPGPDPEPDPEPDPPPSPDPQPDPAPDPAPDPEPSPPFADILGTTHAAAIVAVTEAGIAGGYPDGTYRPDHPVTRGQMATFLANALDLALDGS